RRSCSGVGAAGPVRTKSALRSIHKPGTVDMRTPSTQGQVPCAPRLRSRSQPGQADQACNPRVVVSASAQPAGSAQGERNWLRKTGISGHHLKPLSEICAVSSEVATPSYEVIEIPPLL